MNRKLIVALSLLVLLTACGGDSDPAGPGNNNTLSNGTFNATVNGSAFSAASALVTFGGTIVAIGAANAQGRGLGFAIFASGPGTYTLAQSPGNNANYTEGTGGWGASSATAGSSGSVTFSTLNSSRAVGNFTFSLQPLSGGASGTRTVTGSFDLAVSN
jgi:hypothetical protein